MFRDDEVVVYRPEEHPGFWRRVLIDLIDTIIILLLGFPLSLILGAVGFLVPSLDRPCDIWAWSLLFREVEPCPVSAA